MALEPGAAPVVAAYQRSSNALRERVLAYVTRTWLGLENYRDDDIDRFVAAVVPVVEAGQVQVGALTDAYLARLEAVALDTPARPVGVPADLVTTEALRGEPAGEVWSRPGRTTWSALAEGDDLTTAVSKGATRALELAVVGLQLAHTHAARHVLQVKEVRFYRRVPRAGACEYCRAEAARHYRTGQLMPIHPGCACTTEAIFGRDPGPAMTPADADVAVHEHGEIGPVLARAGDHFTGPSQIP